MNVSVRKDYPIAPLPCPFCGSIPNLLARKHHGDSPTMLVVCSKGCIEGKQFGWETGSTEEQVVAAVQWWNSRA